MKNAMIFLVVILLFANLSAQDCKFAKDEVDKFTHKKILVTVPYLVWRDKWSGSNIYVEGHKVDSLKWLKVRYNSVTMFGVAAGSKLILLFNDSSTAELINLNSVISDIAGSQQLRRYIAFMGFYYNEDTRNSILSKSVVSIRLYTTDGYFDKDVVEQNSESFKNAIRCIE